MSTPQNVAVPASQYNFDELAEIYNQTRIDYIVPMPMNGKRMKEYTDNYDLDLDLSVIVTSEDGTPMGIGMLGVRDNRTWITRLGVVPDQRERRLGSFLMKQLIGNSQRCGADYIQLEVIVGNEPARNMFSKFGFEPTRELLIVRRPPKPQPEGTHPLISELRELEADEIYAALDEREPNASWVEETASLLNAGSLQGIAIEMRENEHATAVFMATPLQIQHIVLNVAEGQSHELYLALLYYIHDLYPNRDTKVENIPVNHPSWRAYQTLEYVISFKRTEMLLRL